MDESRGSHVERPDPDRRGRPVRLRSRFLASTRLAREGNEHEERVKKPRKKPPVKPPRHPSTANPPSLTRGTKLAERHTARPSRDTVSQGPSLERLVQAANCCSSPRPRSRARAAPLTPRALDSACTCCGLRGDTVPPLKPLRRLLPRASAAPPHALRSAPPRPPRRTRPRARRVGR